MLTRLFWINKSIGIMPRPLGNENLMKDIQNWKIQNVTCVVSLLEKEEINDLGLKQEKEYCESFDIEFVHFPIKDRSIPESVFSFKKLVDNLYNKIEKQNKILIHCRAGIGRSGLVASSVLIKQGLPVQEAIEKVSKARKLKIPDTQKQIDFLENLYI